MSAMATPREDVKAEKIIPFLSYLDSLKINSSEKIGEVFNSVTPKPNVS